MFHLIVKPPYCFLFAAVIATGSILRAEEPPRPDASQLLEKAAQAKSEGRYDEAKELYDKAQKLQNEARERDHKKPGADASKDEKFANARREIEQLERDGKHEEAEHRKQELHAAWERQHGGDGGAADRKGPDRFHHLAEAISHLRAAGLNDVAEHLEQQAKQMHEEFERQNGKNSEGDKFALIAGEVQKLREQVNKLTKEMAKLRENATRSGGDGQKNN